MYNRVLDARRPAALWLTAMARAFHEYAVQTTIHNGLVERGDDQHHHRRYRYIRGDMGQR